MPGIEILVSDHHGVYVPKVFTENYNTKRWNVSDSNIADVAGGPENCEWYWESWNNILDNAEYVDELGNIWRLYQDGDLFAICEDLMSDADYENFFGEER